MTSDDWKWVEKELENFYNFIDLDCDGFKLTLYLVRISNYKNAIVFGVNDIFKGKWFLNDCEERRRFFRPTKSYIYNSKYRNKKRTKRELALMKELNIDAKAQSTGYSHRWTSFKSLKAHLIKNNKRIELIKKEIGKEVAQ